ncbi:hypothetical protein [uncultured Desulfobulbus sp.]|uniref:hypothetical protein n=1 Tax=uncultured Desulfobulbus sp. TaxID=239745 RepID=UPI0029C77381|nr:hypothetical protein [uncultured Desulfobulbus sp.]
MSSKPVVNKYDKAGVTHVWHENSAGNTTKEGHRVHHHQSGNVTNNHGKIVGNDRRKK